MMTWPESDLRLSVSYPPYPNEEGLGGQEVTEKTWSLINDTHGVDFSQTERPNLSRKSRPTTQTVEKQKKLFVESMGKIFIL